MKKKNETWMNRFPSISDLEKRAEKRIPHVAWEYLQSGTGEELAVKRNLEAFQQILMNPRFMKGEVIPSLSVKVLGREYDLPFGMAPVGLSGLMWPGAEFILAKTAVEYNIPYCLSTVATQTPETVGPHVGNQGWFQLYSPRKKEVRKDVLDRARSSGFHTLVVTADVPLPSRRERTKRAGLRTPPKITPAYVFDAVTNPSWTWQLLKHGIPKLRTIYKYAGDNPQLQVFKELRKGFGGTLDWEYFKELRDEWSGKLIIKGLTHPEDARIATSIGSDAIIVSNHGGRQFDAVPAAIDCLKPIVDIVGGKTSIFFDSGIRSGLDIVRAFSLGAEFVFLGRPFFYGLAALGAKGAAHVCEILKEDLSSNLKQLGVAQINDLHPNS